MKRNTTFRILPISLSLLLLATVVRAQTTEEKAAKEAEMREKQEQIEFQRQQMKEQQLKTIELEKAYAVQAREADRARRAARVYIPSTGISDEPFIYSFGQDNQSQLTIRNSFDGESDTSEGEFDVDESTTHIRCNINGKANAGKINIKVLYPGGKVFKDLSITSSAQISFSQSLSIKEEEKKKYIGSWSYKISAEKAEGSYTLSFMTQ